jgi:hypothetical protein
MSNQERPAAEADRDDEEIRALLTPFLRVGEELVDPDEHVEDDLRDVFGYEVYPIKSANGEIGTSVFLVMHEPGDGVEAVTLVGNTTLTITAVAGEGIVGVYNEAEGPTAQLLVAGGANPNADDSFQLEQGWSYGYLNTGDGGPFIVRDDSSVTFNLEFETPVADPEVLRLLGEFGIQGVQGEE